MPDSDRTLDALRERVDGLRHELAMLNCENKALMRQVAAAHEQIHELQRDVAEMKRNTESE